MATTTPNYGWTVPTSTDLVKDGATAIETLGDAVDATVYANANAAIAKTIVDAKGDIIAATAADTVSRLAVGSNDQVLTADSSTATGLKWATASSGGMTSIATGTLSGTTVTLSSISASYKNLVLVLRDFYTASSEKINIRFNNDTTSNLHMNGGFYVNYDGSQVNAAINVGSRLDATLIAVRNADSNNFLSMTVNDYANTATVKSGFIDNSYVWTSGGTTNRMNDINKFTYNSSSAINRIDILANGASFSGGTYILYGVS